MKKALSILMAGAMAASMSVAAFAANPAQAGVVYNGDGAKNSDVYASDASLARGYMGNINIDGVVPNAQLYIPIGDSMGYMVTDGTAGTPTNAQIVQQLITDGAVSAGVATPAAGTKYLKADLSGSVTAVSTPAATADLTDVITKLGKTPTAVVASTSPAIGDTLLNAAGTGVTAAVTAAGDITGLGAYEDGSGNVIVATDAEVQGAITAVKNDNATTTAAGADISGLYYEVIATDIAAAVTTATANAPTTGGTASTYNVSLNSLTNKDLFKFDYDKDEGSKYVSKIELVSDKKLGSLDRTAYIKITLSDSTTTSDLKSTGTISFKAKADSKVTGESWTTGKTFSINYALWINNTKASNDDNIGTGDRVYFDPDDNEDNTLVWGDDRAALFFEGNDDASKFYARLQTKADSEIYSTYGDPVNADLWFYDFVGNPTIPSTSRAVLTLGIPWDEDDDYTPNPEDCFIYEKDADGNLIDVTDKFSYSEDNDGTTEIPGWTIKTRTLGTYIVSDTELDTTVAEEVTEEETSSSESTASTGGKEIPNTGSSDMVGAAVVAAIASLAAAGAVAFKKSSK